MELVRQLGELLLQATPTVVLVFLFYLFLKSQFFGPISQALAERSARIEGARRSAETAQAAAAEKLAAYHEALKKARAQIYAEQEAARRTVLDQRTALLREAREKATQRVRSAKEKIAADLAVARAALEQQSEALAAEIVRVILQPPREAPGAPREAR